MAHKLLNNFTAGELSPQLDARIDLQKYDSGCQALFNFRVLPWGGVTRRAGTLFVAEVKDSTKSTRLIPFNFSTSVAYVIEMGEYYMRFYTAGARVLSASAPGWSVGNYSPLGGYVVVGGTYYKCLVAHTNATDFATELAAVKWVVSDAAQIIEVATVFTEAELFEVQFREINDVVYLVHPNHPPQKLARYAATNWEMGDVAWTWPALLDENTDDTRTLSLTPVTAGSFVVGQVYRITAIGTTDFTLIGAAGNVVGYYFTATGVGVGTGTAFALEGAGIGMVANFDAFLNGHVGSSWQLRHRRNATKTTMDLSTTTPGTTYSDEIVVNGDWTFVTTERWYGTVYIERSYDGTTWEQLRVFTSSSDRNVNASGTQDTRANFRVRFDCTGDPYGTPPWSGVVPTTFVKARATFEVADVFIPSWVTITAITDSKHATVTLGSVPENETAVSTWSEGAWSTYQGFPRALGLYEQRMFYAGTTRKPNTAWGSVVADFENFQYSDFDDAAVAYQFASAQQNPIQWLMPMLRLHAGTSGGEHIIASGNLEEPLTPSNVTVRDPSAYGSEYMQAIKVDNAIVFLQRQGRRIREMREISAFAQPNDFVAPDLALLAEHLTDTGIVQLDYARVPDPVLFAVMGNGQLAVMAYNREQNINAWSRYKTNGTFESVAVVYGSPSDVAYAIVNRANGRFIEVFTAEQPEVTFGSVYTDSTVVNDFGGTVITGLDHLEGQDVEVIGGSDGHEVGTFTVAFGKITLPQSEIYVRVGLPYTSQIRPMKIDMMMQSGTSQGRRRRISEIVMRFRHTRGGVWGNSLTPNPAFQQWNAEIPFRDTSDTMDEAPPLFTGDKILPSESVNDLVTDFSVWQTQAQPMTILGLFAAFEVFGN